VKINFENLEIELFQKVIDKKVEEQHFIDSILIEHCIIDTIYYPIDSILLDSIPFIDSLSIKDSELKAK
jgi:hypothetical protein